MDYFISVHPRSNVRFSALFADSEEKSSVHPYNSPSMILPKFIWISHIDTMADVSVNAPVDQAPTMAPPTRTDDQILPHIRWFWDTVRYDKTAREDLGRITQSIHTFIEDKKNMAQHTYGKKKATLIVIPSIRFTKLIIYHLQRKHEFHPRPDFPLHFPNEEPVLGYLKFSAKGTKREVFGMPIPGNLITADIQGESYYQEYLAKLAKHQRYMAGETGSDPDSPAPKPTKTTKKSKPTAPKADPMPPVSKPASSKQPEPEPAPTKTQGKKCKLVIEISDKPSQARKSRPGLVSKRRKPIGSLSKGSRLALSISKMKAAYYPDVGLEQMMPGQMWIEEECKHTSEGDRRAVRTQMWILSVVKIKVFSMYGYDYMKKIVLCQADLNEHVIAERDFKYLYPSDFEDLHLLNLQGHLNHLPPKDKKILTNVVNLWTRHLVIRQRVEYFQLGIESYQTQLNLTKPRWDATGFEYKHDYMIDEALDYRVKEFKINRINPGLNTRFWTRKDVDRSKKFMFAIQKQLKTRRIFHNLESFVGGRVRVGDYRLLKRTD
nr:hypothetical protein [Tanacetum cinerariifolium]